MEAQPKAVGGPIFTFSYKIILGVAALGIVLTIWRFISGLGAATALSDGYPWGIWIAIDVVSGTALACGGYAMAILIYAFNRGKYHPLIRSAILTSALGYSIAGISVMIDVGRPWWAWQLPFFWQWNLNSVLLEVALCIMLYTVVAWIELSPAFLEKWRESDRPWLSNFSKKTLPIINRSYIFLAALGVLLPTMHQSSLGTLMLLGGPKVHPLYRTSIIPLLFLITCISIGYAAVALEAVFSSLAFKRPIEFKVISALQVVAAWTIGAFVVIRFIDVFARGRFGLALQPTLPGIMFWVETLFAVGALVAIARYKVKPSAGRLFTVALLTAVAGVLYRFDAFMIAYDPGKGWHYFPSIAEMFITIGLIAIEIALYVAIVKRFPILSGMATRPATPKPSVASPTLGHIAPSPSR